ncbi:hypothetical protein Bpfe_015454, partial [Biomphalaria pfeifferi]
MASRGEQKLTAYSDLFCGSSLGVDIEVKVSLFSRVNVRVTLLGMVLFNAISLLQYAN